MPRSRGTKRKMDRWYPFRSTWPARRRSKGHTTPWAFLQTVSSMASGTISGNPVGPDSCLPRIRIVTLSSRTTFGIQSLNVGERVSRQGSLSLTVLPSSPFFPSFSLLPCSGSITFARFTDEFRSATAPFIKRTINRAAIINIIEFGSTLPAVKRVSRHFTNIIWLSSKRGIRLNADLSLWWIMELLINYKLKRTNEIYSVLNEGNIVIIWI